MADKEPPMNKGTRMQTRTAVIGIAATCIIGASGCAATASSTTAQPASSSSGFGCLGTLADPTPCTVTHAELNSLERGMTKAQVRATVGAAAHDDHKVYWSRNLADAYLVYKYRETNGQWAYVTYRDRNGDGAGPLRVTRALWLR